MRMIDADSLKERMFAETPEHEKGVVDIFLEAVAAMIDEQPTIERKTGMWLRAEFGVECNLCKRTQITMTPYCSHCGAEMDC